jgi:hypothetical protein
MQDNRPSLLWSAVSAFEMSKSVIANMNSALGARVGPDRKDHMPDPRASLRSLNNTLTLGEEEIRSESAKPF